MRSPGTKVKCDIRSLWKTAQFKDYVKGRSVETDDQEHRRKTTEEEGWNLLCGKVRQEFSERGDWRL